MVHGVRSMPAPMKTNAGVHVQHITHGFPGTVVGGGMVVLLLLLLLLVVVVVVIDACPYPSTAVKVLRHDFHDAHNVFLPVRVP
jgi:hypothetical protein